MNRAASAFVIVSLAAIGAASAQTAPTDPTPSPAPAPPSMPPQPTMPSTSSTPATAGDATATAAPTEDPSKPKEPRRGDFDAGGQVRLPNGPDSTGKFATYNWIALDLEGRYHLLDSISVDGTIPLALVKPDTLMDGTTPKMIGGVTARFEAKLPRMPHLPGIKYDTDLGLLLTLAYMHEGAMLLSDKDYPKFVGNFQPGMNAGLTMKVKLSTAVDFALTPVWVCQAGDMKSLAAVQVPTSLVLRLGSLVQLSADVGVFTGADYKFSGDAGGRVAAGGSLTVKIGPILAHAGGGVASLLTGGEYPTIRDSIYVDLNVKFAK